MLDINTLLENIQSEANVVIKRNEEILASGHAGAMSCNYYRYEIYKIDVNVNQLIINVK